MLATVVSADESSRKDETTKKHNHQERIRAGWRPKTIEMENLTARLAYHGKEAGPNGLAFFGATAMTNIKPGDLVVHNESGELLSVLNVLELPGLDSAALEPYLEIIFEGKYKVMKPAKEFTLRSAARVADTP